MDLKKRIWDFFKQKDDLVSEESVKNATFSVNDLNRRVFYLEHRVDELEKQLAELNSQKEEIEKVQKRVLDMDKIYSRKLQNLEKNKE